MHDETDNKNTSRPRHRDLFLSQRLGGRKILHIGNMDTTTYYSLPDDLIDGTKRSFIHLQKHLVSKVERGFCLNSDGIWVPSSISGILTCCKGYGMTLLATTP